MTHASAFHLSCLFIHTILLYFIVLYPVTKLTEKTSTECPTYHFCGRLIVRSGSLETDQPQGMQPRATVSEQDVFKWWVKYGLHIFELLASIQVEVSARYRCLQA